MTLLPDDVLCRNGAIVFATGDMAADIVLGVKNLSASLAGWDNPSVSLRQSLNHCEHPRGWEKRSIRTAPRQSHGAEQMVMLEMHLLPGVILIGQCLRFGSRMFNLLRRRKLQDPSKLP